MTSTDSATNRGGSPRIGVALKYVPLRVEVNPLTGTVSADDRLSGASPADFHQVPSAIMGRNRTTKTEPSSSPWLRRT